MKKNGKKHPVFLFSTIFLLLFLLFLSTALVATAQSATYAYIANQKDNTVSVIDTATKTIINTVNVGKGPLGVAVSPDGTEVYVANSGGNTVSVIDTSTNKVTSTVSVGNNPYGVAVTPDGKIVYVANYNDGTVSVIDAATNTVTAVLNVGNSPFAVAIAGTKAYVTNDEDKTVSVIDTVTDTVTATLSTGYQYPGGVAVAGKKIYVTNNLDNVVSVIDTATNDVIAVTVGTKPWGIAVIPDGSKAYVTNHDDNTVSVIEAATKEVTANVKVGNHPCGVAVSPDGSQVYVTNSDSNDVSIIDTTTDKVIANVVVGSFPRAFGQFIGSVSVIESKNPPTKEKITDFIAGIPVSDNYIITVFNTVIDKQPTWNCDIWKDKNGNQLLSLYYVDPDSPYGYGAVYLDSNGKKVKPGGAGITCIKSYKGEYISEEITPVDTPADSNKEQSPENERLAEYEERLAEYEERLEEYEEDQSVRYETQPVNYDPQSVEDEDQYITAQKQPKVSSPSVNLYSENTKVVIGEDILLRLSAANPTTKPTMHVEATITLPSGMSVSSREFVESADGQYMTRYDLEPGDERDIEVRTATSQVGNFNVKGRIVYYFGDNVKDGEDYTVDLPIQVETSNSLTPDTESKSVIGDITSNFGSTIIVGIAISLMTCFLRWR